MEIFIILKFSAGLLPSSYPVEVIHIIKNYAELAGDRRRRDALAMLEEGVRAADPQRITRGALSAVSIGDGGVHVVGFGKASHRMLLGAVEALGERIEGGVVITSDAGAAGRRLGGVDILLGDHPLPGNNTLRASERLLDYIDSEVRKEDTVIVLISGGGSALFEKPIPPVSITDVAAVTRLLMSHGADIYELNTVRKHISMVKGGRLAERMKASKIISIIISDVVGDRVDVIASGPTAPDPTTYRDAVRAMKRRGVWSDAPETVREVLDMGAKGLLPETPKPGNPVFAKVSNILAATNMKSLRRMASLAERLGYTPVILSSAVTGEAREVGRLLAGLALHVKLHGLPPLVKPGRDVAVLMGGETTVTVRGDGIGGRNEELALSFLCSLDERASPYTLLAAMGSDGIDGVSPAAGAIVDANIIEAARRADLDCQYYLDRNDSYTFFREVGGLIVTGPTGTNVNDFIILLVYASS